MKHGRSFSQIQNMLILSLAFLSVATLPTESQELPTSGQALAATAATIIFTPDKDSYIDENRPNNNFNNDDETHTKKKTGDSEYAFYFFDISSLAPGDSVVSATLNLYVTDPASQNHQVHRVQSAWNESAMTWNTDNGNWVNQSWATFFPEFPNTYVSVDVTDLVSAWHKGIYANHGFKINSSGNNVHGKFTSREWANSGQRPYLEVNTAPIAVPTNISDLAISKTVDQPIVVTGQTVTYIIIVGNGGPDPATSVQVEDQLPAGVTHVGHSATQGNYAPGTGIWNLGTLATAAADTLHITVKIN